MEYRVLRSSIVNNTQPCDDAFMVKRPGWDVGNGKRTPDRIEWHINLATLEELAGFVERNGECILWPQTNGVPDIEIYDAPLGE